MNFLLDDNFPKSAVPFLRQPGHKVFVFQEWALQGMKDEEVFLMAQQKQAVLLTTDRDFFHTIPHLFESHFGVVVIALRQPNRAAIISRLLWV